MSPIKRPPLAERLVDGIQEAILHAKGELELPVYEYEALEEPALEPGEITRIQRDLQISIADFALAMNVSPRTLQKWDRGEQRPSGPAIPLLHLYRSKPQLVKHAVTAAKKRISGRDRRRSL